MDVKQLLENCDVSRRSLLKSLGAVAVAASAAGCSKSDDSYPVLLTRQDDLVLDKDVQMFHSSSTWNCGSKCVHHLRVKNGRVISITSAGDIPRKDSQASDENIGGPGNPVQRRGCVRCYGYVQRQYQPDRLKYPLKQTKNQGDVNGFKRISWEDATKEVAENFVKVAEEEKTLGYIPFLKNGGAAISYAPFSQKKMIQYNLGNHSTGTHHAAMFETVGVDAYCNSQTDILNSKFILMWAIDPSRTTYWNENQHWYITKAREQGIPVVSITTNYNDSAATIATGASVTVVGGAYAGKTYNIPKWIPCRPATDGALAVAMAYIMYKNGWHNTDFLGTSAADQAKRRCFGFYPNDKVVSQTGPEKMDSEGKPDGRYRTFASQRWYVNFRFPRDYTDETGKLFTTRQKFNGATFTVSAGESFVEYLLSREVEWGDAASDGNLLNKYPQPATPANIDDLVYNQVLTYVANLTGVPVDTMIGLTYMYAKTDPACLYAGGGPQRSWNGQEWCNMMIALAAMTGNISRRGGGTGYTMYCVGDQLAYKSCHAPGAALSWAGNVMVTVNDWAHTILTGKDYRSRARFVQDTIQTTREKGAKNPGSEKEDGTADSFEPATPVDLTTIVGDDTQPLLKVNFLQFRPRNSMITSGNTNKCIEAMKKVRFVMTQDQVMTPTALYSHIVLPAGSIWENFTFYNSMYQGAMFLVNRFIKPIGDAKTDGEIDNLITAKINELTGLNGTLKVNDGTNEAEARKSYETNSRIQPSKEYLDAYPDTKPLTWEQLKEKVVNEYPVSADKPFIGMLDPYNVDTQDNILGYGHKIGELQNSTGFINFWSPLWGLVDKYTDFSSRMPVGLDQNEARMYGDGVRNATLVYEPNPYGYEKFFNNKNPLTGNFEGVTPKVPGRAKYTLLYMTNKPRHRSHTMFDNVAIVKDQFVQTVKMHPVDAAIRGIKNGDMVYIYNDRGCTYIPAEVDNHMPPGVISIEHGAWYRAHPTEKVTVSLNTVGYGDVADEKLYTVPVDVGGCENILTDDYGTTSWQIGFAVSAQGGPCEISLTKPN